MGELGAWCGGGSHLLQLASQALHLLVLLQQQLLHRLRLLQLLQSDRLQQLRVYTTHPSTYVNTSINTCQHKCQQNTQAPSDSGLHNTCVNTYFVIICVNTHWLRQFSVYCNTCINTPTHMSLYTAHVLKHFTKNRQVNNNK